MTVFLNNSDLKDLDYLTEGGEATIYDYSYDLLFKKFKPHVNFKLKEKKINSFLKVKKTSNLIYPEDIVYVNNIFSGYLTKKVSCPEVFGMLSKKNYLKIMNLSNSDILDILIKTSVIFENIHKTGFVIGDISDQNILLSKTEPSFIDIDSYGFSNKFLPDAYTELFTDPNAYSNNALIIQNQETDKYAFTLLCFKILTRMHPFSGVYPKDEFMNIVDRMKNKISVLGNHNITIPSMVPSWKWISPKLLNVFFETFEKGKRVYITNLLLDLKQNLKFCKDHGGYYYGKYSDCPICNENAKVFVKPKVTKTTSNNNILNLSVLFEKDDVGLIIDFTKYLSINGEIVDLQTGTKKKLNVQSKLEFLNNGSTVLEIFDDTINVYFDDFKKVTNSFKRAYKTPYEIFDNSLYYIDKNYHLCKATITKKGNLVKTLLPVYANTIFSVAKDDNYCAILLYQNKKGIIATNSSHITFDYNDKITEYALKYDEITKNWLFIYQTNKGDFRTIVIQNNKIIFDSKLFVYSASPLSNICFANNNIFSPSKQKIVGINWLENRVKEFDLDIITEESKLEFVNGGFNIIQNNKIYRYGK